MVLEIFFLQDGVGESAFSSESFNTYKLLLYWLKKKSRYYILCCFLMNNVSSDSQREVM